jgi:hypothetical protein
VTIVVMYSCFGCGVFKEKLTVKARTDEDVNVWLGATIERVAADHRRQHPRCRGAVLSELWIPQTNSSKIGGPAEQ